MKEKIITLIEFGLLFTSIFAMGWFSGVLYREWKADRVMDGLYIKNVNFEEAYKTSKEIDNYGDWVCINTNGMDFSRGIDVCSHECGHAVYSEIYAEKCEEDMESCIKEMD